MIGLNKIIGGIFIMEKNDMLAEKFNDVMEENKDTLYLLKLKYLAAQIKERELEELFSAGYNEVLKEHIYTIAANKISERYNMKAGDRITSEEYSYLMSDADFEQYLKYAQEKFYAYGYTDEDGKYKPGYDGTDIRIKAENELIDFQISILPEEMKEKLVNIKKDYTHKQKFLNIVMGDKDE